MSVELVNPDIDRVDAVNGPATGIPFLMFKSAEGGPAEAAAEVPVVKAEDVAADDAEDIAEEVAEAEAPNIDGAPVPDDAAAAAEPGDAAWEAVDAAKARVAVSGLAALSKLVAELQTRESAEGSDDRWDLSDAGEALDFALGVLARFSVTEQMEADDAAEEAEATARALGVVKALHLEIHEHPEEPAPAAHHEAPAHEAAVAAPAPIEDAMAPEAVDAPVAPEAPVPAVKPEDVLKAAEGVLPAGLMELLTTFVEGYTAFTEAQNSGAEDEVAAEAPAAPVADAIVPEAPAAHEAPAEPAEAHAEAPAEHAPAEAPAVPVEAEKAPEEDPAEKFKKSMEEAIAQAVAKATEPLLKQIDVLERTPVDSGPLLAGQTPGNAGTPLVRGQEEGAVAKGLLESASAQTAPGTNALAEGIKSLYARTR